MKSSQQLLTLSVVLLMAISAHSEFQQDDVVIGLENVFVPKGFDSNDNIEIVVHGELPNTCYLRPRGEAKVFPNRVVVEMKATKISGENVSCIEAIVPYMISVPLGQMSEGQYEIVVNAGASSERKTSIAIDRPGSSSINNFTYANVLKIEKLDDKNQIRIEGMHPSSCMDIDHVEILTNESKDTHSVLPIIKQTKPVCDRAMKPFTLDISLPTANKKEELVHLRKIDGTALNYLIKNAF